MQISEKDKKRYITIVKLFSKGDKKNYIGYDKKNNAYDIQTFWYVPNSPRCRHGGRGPTICHPYQIITQGGFVYSRNAKKDVYSPTTQHFILDIK